VQGGLPGGGAVHQHRQHEKSGADERHDAQIDIGTEQTAMSAKPPPASK
jgi:hypothetical protein